MPCPHNEITIVQRSQRQSAVAAAAYQSGEKLFCEYDQQVKHYPEKRGIVHNEILLPPNAPQEYADRNTLWNAAEAVEKQWNSQLARRWVLTIPREIPPDQYAALVRDFCRQQFVSKGMCVDFAIHDKGDGNPHAHVMLTMRAMDEHGKWLPKSRKVYDLDENGERIKLPSGRWKSHKEDTVDWNDQKYCEIWRHEWEVIQNRYLEANNRPERVDLRSYERQGLDIIPTVHEGAAVRQMEKRGIQTNMQRGEYQSKICPYGYRKSADGRMEPDPEAAAVVQLIFQLAAEGINATAITRELFRRNIPTPGQYKAAHGNYSHDISRCHGIWSASTILRILEDERYTGVYVIGKRAVLEVGGTRSRLKDRESWYIIPDHHPAIVEKAVFDTVQASQLRFSQPNKKKRDYPLKGKAFCGCCGHALSRTMQKTSYYHCRHSEADVESRCHKMRLNAAELEQAV